MFWRYLSCKVWLTMILKKIYIKNVYVLIFVFLPKKGIVSKKKTHKSCFKILDTCRVIGHHAYIAFHVSVIKKQEFDFLWYQIRQQQAKFWHCSNMELHHWIPCFENLLALLCLGYMYSKVALSYFWSRLTHQNWIKKFFLSLICYSYKNESN